MCGDLFKFNAPSPSPAQEAASQAQAEQAAAQQESNKAASAEDKRKRTADLVGRSYGFYGLRSLIAGPAGGSGFINKKAG